MPTGLGSILIHFFPSTFLHFLQNSLFPKPCSHFLHLSNYYPNNNPDLSKYIGEVYPKRWRSTAACLSTYPKLRKAVVEKKRGDLGKFVEKM